MNVRLLSLLILLLCLFPRWAKADDLCRHLTMNEGLPSNTVRNIVQDHDGFIWLGTDNGLCRYDGIGVRHYPIDELGANQYVSALLLAADGLFVGTERGVFQLRLPEGRFRRLPLDISSAVSDLSLAPDGTLWVATMRQGLWSYSEPSGHRHYAMEQWGGAVSQVLADRSSRVWALTNWGQPALCRLDTVTDRFVAAGNSTTGMADVGGLALMQARDGRLWMGSWENGLLLLHGDGHLEQMLPPGTGTTHIHTLFELPDGTIGIGSDDGPYRFDPATRHCRPLLEENVHRFVYALTADSEGGLWIGSFYNGVTYRSPMGRRFQNVGTAQGLTGSVVSRFCEDRHGRVWVASDDGGLMCYQPLTGRTTAYPQQELLGNLNVHALCASGDDLWIGTYTDGIYALNTLTGKLRHYIRDARAGALNDISSYAIATDRRGRLWVGTVSGLSRYRPESDDFVAVDSLKGMVVDIDEDHEGRLWLSTQDNGLYRYAPDDGGRLRHYVHRPNDSTSLADNMVNAALVADDGTLWVGTLAGLCRYDGSADAFRQVPLVVPSQNVMSIVEHRQALWLATDRGIVRHAEGERVQCFIRHDGLASEQFMLNAGMCSSDGHIYFGTSAGFTVFQPDGISINTVKPTVRIVEPAADLELSASEAKSVTFSYVSLSYCTPEKNQYAYLLEGIDSTWHYVGDKRQATYTDLPPGTYTFRLRGTNNDGVWSDGEATVRVVVAPSFWRSSALPLLVVALLVVAAVGVALVARRRRRRVGEQEQETAATAAPDDEPVAEKEPTTEDDFMARMTQVIEDNLASADLNVGFLAEQMAVSRSGLFAKVKGQADITPNEMIQMVRLRHAARLLREGRYLVSEVSYMVGFSNPSYFSKCFQKQYGMKPADFSKSGQGEEKK